MISRIVHRSVLGILGLLLAVAWGAACTEPKDVRCASGRYCPVGTQCSDNGKECIRSPCGNGRTEVEFGEVCDDGGTDPTDDPPDRQRCNGDCTSNQKCGNGITDLDGALEVCDFRDPDYLDPTTGLSLCAEDCQHLNSECGDGNVNKDGDEPEQCDDGRGANRNDANCTARCHWNVCGDGHTNATNMNPEGMPSIPREDCDFGPSSVRLASDFFCAWQLRQPNPGDPRERTCSQCHWAYCVPQYCGDGRVQRDHEECEPPTNYSGCLYGRVDCTYCDSNCRTREAPGDFCGDGSVDGGDGETCDAVASFACETCGSPDEAEGQRCSWRGRGQARGTLTVENSNLIGQSFSLKDDVTEEAVQFHFVGSNPGTTDIFVNTGWSREQIADAIRNAVNNHATLAINASTAGRVVTFENQRTGIHGNAPIEVSTNRLVPDGMADGRGCHQGQACAVDNDCVSGNCGDDGFCN